MVNELLEKLHGFGSTVYEAFVMPGSFLLTQLAIHAPDLSVVLSHGYGPAILPFMFSLVFWTILIVAGIALMRVFQNFYRMVGTVIRVTLFRISLVLGSFKTKLIFKLREFLPQRKSSNDSVVPAIEFDDLDLAVLRTVSARGPGFALSAPDLAEKFTLRPAQIQRSLDKLSMNRMLDSVIGSTDGFDNYRLTNSGAAFLAMWQQCGAKA